jgi:hypothetical protein
MKLHHLHPQSRGSSLIIVLVFAVLLAGLAVTFLSRNEATIQSARSSANGTRVDIFCQGAVNSLIANLKQEIADGSTVVTPIPGNTTKIYLPMSGSGARQNILPYPVNGACTVMSVVKESLSGQPFYTNGNANFTYSETGPTTASASVTTTPSLNNRSVSLARWNKPLLLPATDYGANGTPDYTPATSASFTAPDWVYVARDGSNPTAFTTTMADSTASNNKYAVGRYAYVIYDESSLLDMNVAGFPEPAPGTTTAAQLNTKGNVGLADLTQLGLNANDVNQLVGWRNYASAQPSGNFPGFSFSSAIDYFNYLTGASGGTSTLVVPPYPAPSANALWEGGRSSGFMHPASQGSWNGQTDRMFGSRQELIHMLLDNIAQSGTDRARVGPALQYLGTFSRQPNSPSWMPATPTPPDATVASTVPYSLNALNQAKSQSTPGLLNQIAPTVLVTKAFTRDDGTIAQIGDPLMKYRFPLRRLEWFNTANQTTYKKGIQRWFCMKAVGDGTWDYVDPDSGHVTNLSGTTSGTAPAALPVIKTLTQVAAAGREPTFWEVLQAAILSGSLGDGNVYNFGGSSLSLNSTDTYPVRHLLQIGLNIIDQYNTNPTPTVLRLGVAEGTRIATPLQAPLAGTKNLPYIFDNCQQGFPTYYPPPNPPPPGLPTPLTNVVAGTNASTTIDNISAKKAKYNLLPQYPNGNPYDLYMQFLLWNPHSNFASNPNTNNLKYRLVADGSCIINDDGKANDWKVTSSARVTYVPVGAGPNTCIIPFQATNTRFGTIDVLTPSDLANISGSPVGVDATYPTNARLSAYQVGVYLGTVYMWLYPTPYASYATAIPPPGITVPTVPAPVGVVHPTTPYYNYYVGTEGLSANFNSEPMNYHLEVQDSQGNWIPYQVLPDDRDQPGNTNWQPGYAVITRYMNSKAVPDVPFPPSLHSFVATVANLRPDPRTMRFGGTSVASTVGEQTSGFPGGNNFNLVDSSGNPFSVTTSNNGQGAITPDIFTPAAPNYTWANLAFNVNNSAASPQYYPSTVLAGGGQTVAAMDQVVRPADGNVNIPAQYGNPYYQASAPYSTPSPARPYFLGRSFNSVAEMGYAFRDEPWKSLDFASGSSADGALLDFFSLSEGSVIAGGVNINTASPQVLQAMLTGAYSDTSDPTSALSPASASAIATAIQTYLGTTTGRANQAQSASAHVMYDPSDIPRLTANALKNLVTNASSPLDWTPSKAAALKRGEEVIARSFADSWNTRTWNLMIDVIAQTGRFPSGGTANSLDNFVVDGERRVWAHVAIDRFTGQIVDLQVEPVSE